MAPVARVLAAGLVLPPGVACVFRPVVVVVDGVLVAVVGALAVGVVGAVGRLRPLVLGGILAAPRAVLAAVVG